MNILGIESSCDETAAAVVKDGREVLSSIVYTQIPLHQPYGGVVPEIASRAHVEKISGVLRAALQPEGRCPFEVDAVAVTYGPGLASSLIVGLAAAKGLALALGKPLIGINHIEAHLHTPFLFDTFDGGLVHPPFEDSFPALGLAVSGGHTTWVDMSSPGEYHIIGQTLDDAAGEAFDKASKLLGLGYPGGPVIDRWAKAYWLSRSNSGGFATMLENPDLKRMSYPDGIRLVDSMPVFPKGRPRQGTAALAGLDAELCVSFSGLKTSLLHYVQKNPPADDFTRASIVAAYQEAIVGALAERTLSALRRRNYKALIIGGGVSLNGRLRSRFVELCRGQHIPLLMAKPKYCGDNAAMIAGLAYYRRNLTGDAALAVDVQPTLEAGMSIA